ncbi:MAG: class I adenylate-forming enzyme family protein [Acidimicrobiales bacterium]
MNRTAEAAETFAQRWRRAVTEVGERTFLVFEASDGAVTELTYGQMDDLVGRVAAGLVDRGARPGSAVHLVQANSIGFVATWLACTTLGAWIVPSDPQAAVGELAEQLRRTHPAVGVCSPSRSADYREAVALAGFPVDVVDIDEDDVSLDALCGMPPAPPRPVAPDDLLAVMFTSGTTSAPKGVKLTQANYAFAGDVMAAAAGLDRFDRQFVVLPLFHANAQYYSFAAAICAGASVALMHAFSASRFVEQARRHAVTHASLFAAPIRMILSRTAPGTAPLGLHHTWFAQNLSSDHYAAISALFGCRPRQLYGMTETVPAVLTNPAIGSVPTSMGTPTLGCHVRVVDEDGEPVAPGESGAIQVGGVPGHTLFRGYLDDPVTTAAAIVERDDGERPGGGRHRNGFVWFDTGDRATVNGDGFHYFDGRRSDVLKVAGENVSIVEVEHVLGEHPAVEEVAVVGAADPVRDEVPEAFVVLTATAGGDPAAAAAELDQWAGQHLAPSKRPRAFHVVEQLPRTSVGKIRKFLLAPEAAPPARTQSVGDDESAHGDDHAVGRQ